MCDFSQYGGPSEEWLAVEKDMAGQTYDISTPPEILQRGVNEFREKASSKIMGALAPQVHIVNHTIPTRDGSTIEARTYRPVTKKAMEKLPVYLHLHGGGFIFGTLAAEDATCASIAIKTGIIVLNVNYRHTPHYTFPTAWNDSQDAFAWLHDHIDEVGGDSSKVLVGGISAGGQLTASLVLEKQLGKALSKYPPIAGQILMIPCVAHPDTYKDAQMKQMRDPSVSSYMENENAPVLSMKNVRFFTDLLKAGIPDLRDTKLNPGNATPEEVKGMPPAVFGIAGLDPLRDEALLYAKMLAEAGVATDISLFKGVPHGARRFGDRLSVNKRWDEVMMNGISWVLGSPEASGKFEVKVLEK
ncbi:alpha/beta hydrolase fold-3 domain-containing protein [Lojkania enalia]|uniref:Alpha/beta hydrolase fold-3 domain-containing protein n=1 Tax=Lojkania enalia TaxID=147567 RepID=A0A9P4K595_9PLEO|nr:alpha/beta hydrolase fold-3 domain-containing protein [Didymosphaeria enalia]